MERTLKHFLSLLFFFYIEDEEDDNKTLRSLTLMIVIVTL